MPMLGLVTCEVAKSKSLTFDQFPHLADSLIKSGCANQEILNHCRGPGPHVRGCWVVDGVPGKE